MAKADENRVVYSDNPVEIIKLARAKGWSDETIIKNLMQGWPYEVRLAIAKKYAPAMGLKLKDFIPSLRRQRS